MILGSGLLQASGKTRLTLYTTKSGTFNPTIVASDTSGIVWDFGDGSATYTGGTPSHSYADGTQKTVRITFEDPTLVTQLNFSSMSLVGEWPMSSLVDFTALTHYQVNGNTGLEISGTLLDFPAAMFRINLYGVAGGVTGTTSQLPSNYFNAGETDSVISGPLSGLPSTISTFSVDFTDSNFTGPLSDVPAGVQYLTAFTSQCNISGGNTAMAAVGIRQINIGSSSTTQANIDDILARLYTDRASFTYATPVLNVGGTNPNPTGTYADATPPTSGLEYAYKLVNDPDAEGFKKWAVTY